MLLIDEADSLLGNREGAQSGWEVSIEHQLDLGWPLIGRLVAARVIGPQFVEAIARRTLRRVKTLAEAGA